jgi:hypothetical protein
MDVEDQIPPTLPLQKGAIPPLWKEGLGEISTTICLFNYGLLSKFHGSIRLGGKSLILILSQSRQRVLIMARPLCVNIQDLTPSFTPLEIVPRCSAEGLGFIIIPAGFNAPLGFESQRLEFLTGFT